jgi:D-ribose pyranase
LLKQEVPMLNPRLLAVLAGAGHTDLIVIADAGLPVPTGVEVIDLSLVPGVPSFLQVFDAVRQLLQVERAVLARETREQPLMRELMPRLQGVAIDEIPHEQFKQRTREAVAIIRTGECTPYANLGLIAGVTF